jgi:DNA-binding Xre family transcriptional regulator
MTLHEAIKTTMQERGLQIPDLLAGMQQRDRSTVYRLLKGDTHDAKIGTLVAVCRALGVTPNDLLVNADLWPDGRSTDQLDVRLRQVFADVQGLASPYRVVAVAQIERLVQTWHDAADGLLTVNDGGAG